MDIHHDGDLELGPDPIGGGDKDWVAVFLTLKIEETAETTDPSQETRTRGLQGNGLNSTDQAISSGDIHAGFFVGYALFAWHFTL
jgi:hypothetical protein